MSVDIKACTEKILEFQSSAFDVGAKHLVANFNQCISELLGDNQCLVFLILQGDHKLSRSVNISALGSTVLEETISFEANFDSLYNSFVKGNITMLDTSVLDENLIKRISTTMRKVPSVFLCVPFLPNHNELPCFVCCIMTSDTFCNCKDVIQSHSSHVEYMLRYCGNTISLAMLHEEKERLYQKGRDMLNIAEHLFQNLGNVDDVLKTVMAEAKKLVNAERCALYLADWRERVLKAKVFEGRTEDKPFQMSIDEGIAGLVARTGQPMNVRDVYKEPLFYKKIDEHSGFRTRSMLCIPILSDNEVIAVVQLCNKTNQLSFNHEDEKICKPFASYCGISIKHTILYENVLVAKARQKLTNELMLYHLTQQVILQAKENILECNMDHKDRYHYEDFSFSPFYVDNDHTICVSLEMFDNLGILQKYDIPRNLFMRFLLYVKSGYRDNPYHNWKHAFSTTHFGYLEIIHFKLIEDNYICLLEAMAFLVACLGHDIDHRGRSNAFESSSGSALASLYSSQGSVMERHHFNQTMCILHLEDCNIFEHVNKEEYTTIVNIINRVILATDLANHFRSFNKAKEAFSDFSKEDVEHKQFLLNLMMTGADLSMQTKDWPSVQETAKCLYEEYFKQGDLELAIGVTPTTLTDRRVADIPRQQIEFVSEIVLPIFQVMEALFPEQANRIVRRLHFNAQCWRLAADAFSARQRRGQEALDILADKAFEQEVLALVRRAQETGENP